MSETEYERLVRQQQAAEDTLNEARSRLKDRYRDFFGTDPPVKSFYEAIKETIKQLEEKLAQDEQLNISYHLPNGDTILVSDMGYHGPNLLILYGTNSAQWECQVLVHTQAAHLVTSVVKLRPEQPQRIIGFRQ